MFDVIHDGHELAKAFNSINALPLTVRYCVTCTGHFHGCYCEVDGCVNCEVMEDIEIF